ncbi:MAG: 16S rRNA (cytosine(967)-C(5))-methyltransferase RsmB [Lachnospiraceae bacterium]|nr:16S rRNA (cytosine(967)-C(5))-methyltransferase RsmB [Lachnospiraceae bacterium]
MKENNVNSRELIVTMLMSINSGDEYSHILIRNVLDKYDYLDNKEKAFIKNVTEGSIERRIELDYIIDSFSKTPVKKMKPFIRELMRMSVYQLVFLDKVPSSAVINEAVKLAKKKGFVGLSGFVNGVLRSVDRGYKEIKYPKEGTKEYRMIKYSMPEWIIDEFDSYLGADKSDKVFEAFLLKRPVVIRVSERLSVDEVKELVGAIEETGVSILPNRYSSRAYTLAGGGVTRLPGFAEGRFTVQDISSQICVMAAGIKKGDNIIDVCAAPGGKSVYASELAGNDGHVIARDLTSYKTSLITESVMRMGLKNVSVEEWDATNPDESKIEKADVVIADLPCMGFGVMGRKRDIKYNVNKPQLEEVVKLQRSILDVVSGYVKKGGTLIYSTCSISASENIGNAEYIEKQLGFTPSDITPYLSEGLLEDVKRAGAENELKLGRLQLLPGFYDSDGFFVSRFIKK